MIASMPQDELRSLLICSFRYALGRTSYVTLEISDLIKKYSHIMLDHDRKQIIKDIEEADENKMIGMMMDRDIWLSLAEHLKTLQ